MRIATLTAVVLLLAIAVGWGLMVTAPTVLIAFGAWAGGVMCCLTVQEILHVRAAAT